MDIQCDVCGALYDEAETTVATTTYNKAGEDLKVTSRRYCDFCLHQVPDFVKVYGDGTTVDPDPDEEIEEDITGVDEGTIDVGEEEE